MRPITCTPVHASGSVSAEDLALTAKICAGVQRVDRGVFVPFRRARSGDATAGELAVVGGPLLRVQVEPAASAPRWRLEPVDDHEAPESLIDRGTLGDGTWSLFGGRTRRGVMQYDAVTRRTISGVELACFGGDADHDEAYARRMLAMCEAIDRP